ncbi:hypothetical protein RXV86_18155 [Alisedimentitalea sp. MJ-SS2]|uniref:hypothetical protein n=1 Tax=Aliisedimentitalea sp. MJ-SS2 TaxID=3049795 RepID=UPI0029098E9A|nr:hypothetical protein [Alisedimentitalea sp. MJ-SS2]MDU8929320.1 hypothetical protein [Alisedimentitalea sp. MJ-SS2]
MAYLRMYADESGESRLETMPMSYEPLVYAPPAPALGMSDVSPAAGLVFVQFENGWDSELHPSPRKQMFMMLSGVFQGGLSDGTTYDLYPGDVVLMEDTTGKGHSARVLGDAPVEAVMVHLV